MGFSRVGMLPKTKWDADNKKFVRYEKSELAELARQRGADAVIETDKRYSTFDLVKIVTSDYRASLQLD